MQRAALVALSLAQVTTLPQAESAISLAEARLVEASKAVTEAWSGLSAGCAETGAALAGGLTVTELQEKEAQVAAEVAAEEGKAGAAGAAEKHALEQVQSTEETYASASSQKATKEAELEQQLSDGADMLAVLDQVLEVMGSPVNAASSGEVLGVMKGLKLDGEAKQEKWQQEMESGGEQYVGVMSSARKEQKLFQATYVEQRTLFLEAQANGAALRAVRSQLKQFEREVQQLIALRRNACGAAQGGQMTFSRQVESFGIEVQTAAKVATESTREETEETEAGATKAAFIQLSRRESPEHTKRKQAATSMVRAMAVRTNSSALAKLADSLAAHSLPEDIRMLASFDKVVREDEKTDTAPPCETARLTAAAEQASARDALLSLHERRIQAQAGVNEASLISEVYSAAVEAREAQLAQIAELDGFKSSWADATDAAIAADKTMADVAAFAAAMETSTPEQKSFPTLAEILKQSTAKMVAECESGASALLDTIATLTIKESVVADGRSATLAASQKSLSGNTTEVETLDADIKAAEDSLEAARAATDAAGCHSLSVERKVVRIAQEVLAPRGGLRGH